MRDMAAVLGIMSYMKNVDQDDPQVIFICRCVYGTYLIIVLMWYLYVAKSISTKNDQRKIKVPVPKNPFAPPPAEGEPPEPTEQEKTVAEYDTEVLNQQRSAVLTSTLFLSFLHFRMGSVTPLVVSPATGLLKLVDDPMTKLHILGHAAEGMLKRPFKKPANPLLSMMGVDDPNAPPGEGGSGADGSASRAVEGEDLAGNEDEETETEEEIIEEVIEEIEEEDDENEAAESKSDDKLPPSVPATEKAEDGESKKDK